MKIEVQKHHIEKATCAVPQRCMIAHAIRESDPSISYVAVRTNGITVTQMDLDGIAVRTHWSVPTVAAKAIIKFDHGQPVKPFSFVAKLIDREVITPRKREMERRRAAVRDKAKAARLKAESKPSTKPKITRIAGV